MTITSHITILVCLLVFTVSCGSKQDKEIPISNPDVSASGSNSLENQREDEEERPSGSEVVVKKNNVTFSIRRAVEVNDDFSNIEELKGKLNTFIIKAQFEREFEKNGNLKCSKVIGGLGDSKIIKINFFDTEVNMEMSISDSELKLDIVCQVLSDKEELSSANFSLHRSLLISEKVLYRDLILLQEKEDRVVDRLIVLKSGLILTNGESVSLKVHELYSDEGTIMTFSEDARRAANQGSREGLSGGEIFIKATKSFGKLNVVMAGTNGDDQLRIPAIPVNSFPHIDSSRNAIIEYEGSCPHERRVPIGELKKLSSKVEIGGPGGDLCRNWKPKEIGCLRQAIPGPDGKNGNPGENGYKGGDSGKINFITEEASSTFEINFVIIPGKGGAGALGSVPTLGGIGGNGGKYCSKASDGKNGNMGKNGDPGDDGQSLKACYKIVQKDIDSCK